MRKSLAFLGAMALLPAGVANAATMISFTPGGSSPPAGQAVVYDFDSTTPASLVLSSSVQIKSPPGDSNGAPPANSTPAGTKYLSVLAGGMATISFLNPVSAFSFDWGSIDDYNTLTLLTSDGLETVIPGSDFFTPANGDQVDPGTNGLFQAFGTGDTLFNGFRLESSKNSFEIDNVAVPVPEPAAWLMMLIGFAGIGTVMRRRGGSRVARVRFSS
ncbi:PEPxxWA-CTERM sorting domain-containing protein [Novosphingobium sp. Gsoil 351]|uniref:Npun_F0296 family exosortase-dependent surface protein n=1 Tax=Novosphingobium sp. Gsoil 351 TaxID=2675225 RepID=UPI0018A82C4A|nr:PEPxxWA-CTERM sorting domain-containing protein [Novosphingobium sp. Gsoil 351]